MKTLVLDASIALKWLVPEPDSEDALGLRKFRMVAPDLLLAECANALWKKFRRNELVAGDAIEAARLLHAADIEFAPARGLLEQAVDIATALDHPAYDCFYIALAEREDCPVVTADRRLLNIANRSKFRDRVVSLQGFAG